MEKIDIFYRKKTKRWLGLLTFCLLFFMGQIGFAQQCNISVTISSDGWGDVSTWELLDGDNNVVLSGGPYEEGFEDTQNYTAINPPYSLKIVIDDWGYCDNIIDYSVSVGGSQDIQGTVNPICSGVQTQTIPLNADLTACIPACPAPTALTAEVTANSAALGWTGTGDFDIKWGASGFDVETEGTLVAGASNPYNLGGLTTDAAYQFYVRQDCDGDFSDWVGPFSFVPSNSVSIGTGESTNMNIPVYTYYGYNASQQIVTASELGNPGTKQITKIRWYIGSNANLLSSSDNWQVYLGNTTKTDFVSGTDWVLAGDMTQVFSGTVTAVNASWMEITLSSTFIYTGDNLVVAVSEVEPSYAGSSSTNTTFGSYTSASNTGIYIRNDTSPYNFANSLGTGTRTSILARLQIELSEPPACFPPTALTASNLTFSSADLGWTSDGEQFDIKWGAPGFDVEEEGTLVEDFENGATLSGLDAETTYEFYVRQNCGEEMSDWAGPYSFYTGYCVPTGTSNSYRITGVSTSGGYTNISNLSNGTSNPYSNYTAMSVTQSPGESISYAVTVPSSTGVKIWIDLNQDLVFDETELVASHTTYMAAGNWTGTIQVPEELPLGEYRIRIRSGYYWYPEQIYACGVNNGNYGEAEDYILSVVAPPTCFPPTDLTATPTSLTGADISWTASEPVPAEGYVYAVTTSPTAPESGTSVVGTSASVSDLISNTTYYLHVRANCGEEDYSDWATTSFWLGYCIPTGAANNSDEIMNFTLNNLNNDSAASEGTAGYMDYSGTVAPAQLPAGVAAIASLTSGSGSGNHGAAIWIDYDQNGTFDDSEKVAWIGNTIGASATVSFPAFTVPAETTPGIYRLRVMYRHNVSGEAFVPCVAGSTYAEIEDYAVQVLPPPSCLPPTDLSVLSLTFNSATLAWVSDGSLFDIEYGVSGFTPTGNPSTGYAGISGTTHTLTGLEAETNYQYYVRQDCGDDDLSNWSGPFNFYTGYCLATSTGISYRITGFATTDGYTNIDNLNNGTTSGYNNYSHMTVTQSEGGTFNYTITVPAYTNVEIWIDVDQNLVFDPVDELLASYTDYGTSATTYTGSYIVPTGMPLGDYRLRVRSRYYNYTATPCGSLAGGETEDYTIRIVETPTCFIPSALAVTSTHDSAVLNWTSEGNTFDIKWGVSGFNFETEGTLVEGVSNNYNLSGVLTSNTNYQFYVRQNCGGGDLSDWAGPFSFTTLCAPVAVLPYTENFDTYGTGSNAFPDCWERPVTYTSGTVWPSIVAVPGSSTPNSLRFQSLTTEPTYAVSPAFAEDINNLRVRFNLRREGTSSGTIDIGVMSDPADLSTFELIETINPSDNVFHPYMYDLNTTALSGGNNYIAFRHNSNSSAWYYWLDDFVVELLPSCIEPSALTANPIHNSAVLGWDSAGENFEISWGEGTFNAEEGTIEPFTNGGTLSGLMANTAYQFYVRQNCGGGDLSAWAGPFSFTTLLANDNIEGAISVECGGTYTGSTATATNDQPNPAIFGVAATLSPNVWYSYTGSGEPELITASLCNSGFDTAILIATGTPGDLTWVAGNEDAGFNGPCGSNTIRSYVQFNSDGVTTYYIMVRGYGVTSTGTYELVITCEEACSPAAANDEAADAEIVILGTPLATNNTCATASSQSYPTCGSLYATYYDTWYTFNSGDSGSVNVIITPEVDVTVGFAVYSGTPASLTQVACTTTGATNFIVTPNTTYYVRAYSTAPTAKGEFLLSVSSICNVGEWIGGTSTAWNTASNWCGGVVPDSTTDVVIASGSVNYPVISGDVEVASMTVESGASITVNGSLTTGDITVANGGNFVVANGASLMQAADAVNTGAISVHKTSNPMFRLDYTLWSSPVSGQNLQAFSPETLPTRIYKYDAATDSYDNTYPESTFLSGQGYLFRSPNDWVINDGVNTAQAYSGVFTGVANNGNVPISVVSNAFNGLGNPYPSAIDAEELFAANSTIQAIYFWTNSNAPVEGTYVANNWASWTTTGGTSADGSIIEPNGEIAVGQGFIAQVNGNTSVTFNNDMRIGGAGMFFRAMQDERHRLWLNLVSNELTLNQILIGYVSGATQGEDNQIDGEMFGYGESALYSLINNSDKQFVIQGRSLPFEPTDVVPLGFKATTAGEFTISLANFDGLFAEGQNIYLKDNVTQIVHNLKEGAYAFISEEGTFDTRFEVVYQTTMSVDTPNLDNNWIVFKQGGQFQIMTQGFDMKSVQVFDMLGRTVYASAAEGTTHTIARIDANQVLIVKVTTADGDVLTKKVQN